MLTILVRSLPLLPTLWSLGVSPEKRNDRSRLRSVVADDS